MTSPATPLPKLERPPIAEVACGVVFESLAIDPVSVGPYAQQRLAGFPRHEIKPALEDVPPQGAPSLVFGQGLPRLRTWLISADDALVLQLQHDRFFLNWRRAGGAAYPRFSDHAGQRGLLSRSLEEFAAFSEFWNVAHQARPVASRIELVKIDHLIEGRDWRGISNLADALPWLRPLIGLARSDAPGLQVQFAEPRGDGLFTIALQAPTSVNRTAILETRVARPVAPGDDLRSAFVEANRELNAAFAALVPPDQQHRRFNEASSHGP